MSSLFNKEIDGKIFNFQQLEFNNETGYHIDVKDDEGKRWEFRMFPGDDKQGVIHGENLPEWILSLESDIQTAINQFE